MFFNFWCGLWYALFYYYTLRLICVLSLCRALRWFVCAVSGLKPFCYSLCFPTHIVALLFDFIGPDRVCEARRDIVGFLKREAGEYKDGSPGPGK
jgi:hypothetical protein